MDKEQAKAILRQIYECREDKNDPGDFDVWLEANSVSEVRR